MKMLRIILFFSFVFFSGSALSDASSISYYSTYADTLPACVADADGKPGIQSNPACNNYGGLPASQCVGGSASGYRWASYLSGVIFNHDFVVCPNGYVPCDAGQVRSFPSGVCSAPPVVCTAGQTKTILVVSGTYPPAGTPPTIVLNHDRTSTMEQPITVSQGGCVYTIPLNPNQNTGCSTSSTGVMYCRVQATQTGANVSGADTALDAALTTDQTPVPSAKAGCILTQSGEEICATTPEKNCGTVNGVQVCVKDQAITSNGLPAAIIDGKVTVGESTNVNGQAERCWNSPTGQPICINPPVASCGSGTLFTCITPEPTATIPSPPTFSLSHDVQTVTKNSSVTNPDNTLTKTATTTVDVAGTTPYQVTETYNQAGALIQTVYTGAKLGNGTAVSSAPGDGSDNVDTGAPGTATVTGDTSGLDTVFDGVSGSLGSLTSGIDSSKFITNPVSLPAVSTCQTVAMDYKSLHYTFDPCSKLATFREMFGYLLYVLTAYSIYDIATRRPV